MRVRGWMVDETVLRIAASDKESAPMTRQALRGYDGAMTTPSWLAVHPGRRPLLLFAPHGGRRHAPRQPGRHKVNDLHTAELTRELASRWDATAIVNDTRDRNELDLNRISDVRRQAPWLPRLLADVLASMVEEHGSATLLVVHGWNAVQTVCDVGMGVVERDGRCIVATGGGCTASERFIASKVRALQTRARSADITVTIGARYPAAHPNNLLQLFTAAHLDDDDAAVRTLARLAGAGQVAAAQLELGIPLRWPGRFRTAFMAALTDVFTAEGGAVAATGSRVQDGAPGATDHGDDVDAPTAARTPAARGGDTHGSAPAAAAIHSRGLQFVTGDLLGFTGIDANGPRTTGGRLLLSPDANTLALFTGELADRHGLPWTVPRLRYTDAAAGAWRVRYAGPLLSFPTLTPFLDLEQGLARGKLIEAAVELEFTPAEPLTHAVRRFGSVAGTIRLGDARWEVSAGAVAHDSAPQTPRHYPFCRLTLPDVRGGLELVATGGVDESAEATVASGSVPPSERRFRFELAGTRHLDGTSLAARASCSLVLAGDGGRLILEPDAAESAGSLGSTPLEGVCERLIPVRRPGRAGAVVHTVFALVRLGNRPAAWLELATEHRP